MNNTLSNQVALVTGSSRGIGKATAIELARHGASVVVNFLSSKDDASETVKTIESIGGKAILVQADVSKEDQVDHMIETIVNTWGKLDILVNNAGINRDRLILRMTSVDWDDVMNINLKGAFLCVKKIVPHMIKARYGRIINTSSIVGLVGNPGQTNYSASKSGLIGFTKSLAREIASRNITVNAIAPGYISTDMVETVSDKTRKMILDKIPLNRFGNVQEVAATIAFLCSQEASYITGQVIVIDGGMTS